MRRKDKEDISYGDKKIIGVQVSNSLNAKLIEVADRKEISVSALIRMILMDYFYEEAREKLDGTK
jgi:hypothetical protein